MDPASLSSALPSTEDLFVALRAYLSFLPDCPNLADYAFLYLRTRRGPAFAMQKLSRPGAITICPYFDLDAISTMMSINPREKLAHALQSRCLELFWPALFHAEGSRRAQQRYDLFPAHLVARRAKALGKVQIRHARRWNWDRGLLAHLALTRRFALSASLRSETFLSNHLW